MEEQLDLLLEGHPVASGAPPLPPTAREEVLRVMATAIRAVVEEERGDDDDEGCQPQGHA